MSPLPERRAPRKPLGKRTDEKPKRRSKKEPDQEPERTTRKKGSK